MKNFKLFIAATAFATVFASCSKESDKDYVETSSVATKEGSVNVTMTGTTTDNVKLADTYKAEYYSTTLTGKGYFSVDGTDTTFSFSRYTTATENANSIYFSFSKSKKISNWYIRGDYMKDLGTNKVLAFSFGKELNTVDTVSPITNLTFNKTTGAIAGKYSFSQDKVKVSGDFSVTLVQLLNK